MTFFLITTDHLETRLWFLDDDDFKTGMNYVATVAFMFGVRIIAFILMSNHVHFVLECTRELALRFITEFKRLYSRYLNQRHGTKELLRGNGVDIQELRLGDESLERAIAYVQMNCVAANICLEPAAYPWGTGRTFFQVSAKRGQCLGALSARRKNKLLHSKMILPAGWMLGEDGYILPESYVPVRFVESLFRTPRRMQYFLQSSSKAKRVLDRIEKDLPAFRDQVILAAIPDLCHSLFQKRSIEELDIQQRTELARQIRYRFSADIHQIARVSGIPYQQIAILLESF
ncbi:MAG: transposase [Bacteroidales bacterium]|jgi:REP element-mobilizing transposase RayT|nr:transposase [Bacteroidales bacterium]